MDSTAERICTNYEQKIGTFFCGILWRCWSSKVWHDQRSTVQTTSGHDIAQPMDESHRDGLIEGFVAGMVVSDVLSMDHDEPPSYTEAVACIKDS